MRMILNRVENGEAGKNNNITKIQEVVGFGLSKSKRSVTNTFIGGITEIR